MAKVNMKETAYYKSGKMRENGLLGLQKGAITCAEQARNRIDQYNLEPKLCSECNKPLSYKQRNYTFCSHACGAAKSNRCRQESGYEMPINQRESISIAIKTIRQNQKLKNIETYHENPKFCVQCSMPLPFDKRRAKTCSKQCLKMVFKKSGQRGGLKTASGPRAKRSKNEIAFANLCSLEFKKVTCNEPLFDGWDADVLIYDHKIAVLWNGDWHYREMGCYNHNLSQVQTRDAFKSELIKKHGWLLYIVKDTSDKPTKPEEALSALRAWIVERSLL